jgi:hypothetical protein
MLIIYYGHDVSIFVFIVRGHGDQASTVTQSDQFIFMIPAVKHKHVPKCCSDMDTWICDATGGNGYASRRTDIKSFYIAY